MPLWLQLITAVSAALASGIMGAAFVPFLRKQRFCEPESPKDGSENVQHSLRPTMGGVLCVFGCLFGLVLSYALYHTFSIVDHTSATIQQLTRELVLGTAYALFMAVMGFVADLRIVRRRPLKKQPLLLRAGFVFLITALFLLLCGSEHTIMDFAFIRYDAGILYIPFTAAIGTLLCMQTSCNAEKTDGMCISVGSVALLGMAVLLMQEGNEMHALLSLAAAGGCMGCFVWNLHPAKCRLGNTGVLWVSGIVTAVCLISRLHMAMLLMLAVSLVNRIPSWRKNGITLQESMQQAGMKHWQRIAVFAGFAAFCVIAAVIMYE